MRSKASDRRKAKVKIATKELHGIRHGTAHISLLIYVALQCQARKDYTFVLFCVVFLYFVSPKRPFFIFENDSVPSVLWRCWLGDRKGIRPVITEWWGAGLVICLKRGADLHMAQVMPMPLTVSYFCKIQIGFTLWYRLTWVVPEKGPLNGCVCNCQKLTNFIDFWYVKSWENFTCKSYRSVHLTCQM